MGEIEQLLEAYASAARAKDVDALVALYADDVEVFDAWAWSHRGIDAWRAVVEGWFGSVGDDVIAVTFDEVRTGTAGDGAVAHMVVRYAGESAAGEELRSLENRMTWVLERRGDGWRVVHEHSSAPADPATGKIAWARSGPA
jgi:uncharacterized protein (TIGR02246 family)